MSRLDDLITTLCPNGVEFRNVGEIAKYVRGVTYSKDDESEVGSIRVLRSNNITLSSNTLNFDDVKRVSEHVRVRDDQRLRAQDILISAASGSRAHIGKVAFIWDDIEYTFGGFMAVVRTNTSILPRFLFHLLVGDRFARYLEGALSTSTINNLNSTIMGGFRIPVPPIEVQQEIVRILDHFTELEAELEAELVARRRQYDEYKLLLLAPNDSGSERKEFKTTSLDELCSSISAGGDLPSRYRKGQEEPSDEFPFPIFSNGTGATSLYGFTNGYKVNSKAVTVSARGTIGYHTLRDAKFTPIVRLIVLIPNENIVSPEYLNFALDTTEIAHSGGSIPQLTVPSVRKIMLQIPSLERQLDIVEILDKFDALVNDLSTGLPAELNARRKQYEYYRDKLLTFDELPS